MTVLVVHPITDKALDVSGASIYGDFKYVNRRYVYMDELAGMGLPVDVRNRMLKAVDEFDPEADYLLIAGDHLQLIAISALLADRWGIFRVLRYDRAAKGYAPVQIECECVGETR
jgi:hypothetical protein